LSQPVFGFPAALFRPPFVTRLPCAQWLAPAGTIISISFFPKFALIGSELNPIALSPYRTITTG